MRLARFTAVFWYEEGLRDASSQRKCCVLNDVVKQRQINICSTVGDLFLKFEPRILSYFPHGLKIP